MDDNQEKSKPRSPAPLDPQVQADIDANLRRVYDDALNQELPDRFRLLLQQLREKERKP